MFRANDLQKRKFHLKTLFAFMGNIVFLCMDDISSKVFPSKCFFGNTFFIMLLWKHFFGFRRAEYFFHFMEHIRKFLSQIFTLNLYLSFRNFKHEFCFNDVFIQTGLVLIKSSKLQLKL